MSNYPGRAQFRRLASFVDSGNSSTVALDADATFTGEWVDTLGYGIIFVNVFTDVASATDGLSRLYGGSITALSGGPNAAWSCAIWSASAATHTRH